MNERKKVSKKDRKKERKKERIKLKEMNSKQLIEISNRLLSKI